MSLRTTLYCAAVVALAGSGAAQAQPQAGALACVYDRLQAADRELIADSVLGGETGDPKSKAAEAMLNGASAACATTNGWDKRRAGLSGAYAMNRAVYDTLDHDFAEAGVASGKLKALWATLSAEDRAALRLDDIPDAVASRLVVQLKAAGVPGNPDDLLEAYSSLTALSEVAAIEAAWRAP